ncbi:MAG: V-type ATPase subunit [Lentisphaeria bacterium]
MHVAATNLDYLVARLHGRRSRLAEEERLEPLCRLSTLSELSRAVLPGADLASAALLQRGLLQALLREWSEIAAQLDGAAAAWMAWLPVRFQVENLKVLARGVVSRTPWARLREHLVALPDDLALDAAALLAASDLEAFAARLPAGRWNGGRRKVSEPGRPGAGLLLLEAALDGGYFQELLARTALLPAAEQETVRPLVSQEVAGFLLMLAVRGRFWYQLPAAVLAPLHVRGGGVTPERFAALLAAPDLAAAAGLAVGQAIDALPAGQEPVPALLEALVWSRFRRLANQAFRRRPLGFGAVAGYAGLRRVETANLITVSEGIRLGLPAGAIRARLIPRAHWEATDV